MNIFRIILTTSPALLRSAFINLKNPIVHNLHKITGILVQVLERIIVTRNVFILEYCTSELPTRIFSLQ